MKVIEGDNEILFEADNDEIITMEGFFSSLKKIARNAVKIAKPFAKMGLLPQGTEFGLKALSALSKRERKTGKRARFTTGAVSSMYKVAYYKGYRDAIRKARIQLNRLQK